MRTLTSLTTTIAAAVLAATPVQAGNVDAVKALYTDFFTVTAPAEKREAALKGLADHWQSIGDYSGKHKTREELSGQLAGFAKLIPDLTWNIEEIIESGDTVVVRGRATGTPRGPLFGVDGKGKSFTIMSIDIHKLQNGKVARTYHIEDWAGALRQLSAQ